MIPSHFFVAERPEVTSPYNFYRTSQAHSGASVVGWRSIQKVDTFFGTAEVPWNFDIFWSSLVPFLSRSPTCASIAYLMHSRQAPLFAFLFPDEEDSSS